MKEFDYVNLKKELNSLISEYSASRWDVKITERMDSRFFERPTPVIFSINIYFDDGFCVGQSESSFEKAVELLKKTLKFRKNQNKCADVNK